MGLMGAIAETVGKGLGEQSVIGVIPAALEPREVGWGSGLCCRCHMCCMSRWHARGLGGAVQE